MAGKILITGGSGMIGTRLTELLHDKGHKVVWLSRKEDLFGKVPTYRWDIERRYIDMAVFRNVDGIIHLAGANIGELSWTSNRKREIVDSRVKSAELLYSSLSHHRHSVKCIVGASAIGYYGDSGNKLLTEINPSGFDFLANTCKQWEHAEDRFSELGIRVVNIRTGLVLTNKGGALPPLEKTIRYYIGAPLGKGNQYYSWIHIDDLCNIYIKALENESMSGPFNAVAPQPFTNKDFTKTLAKVLDKPLWLPKVPSFILKLFLGERSHLLLDSLKVSNQKLLNTGFKFQHLDLEEALRYIYGKGIKPRVIEKKEEEVAG